MNTSADHIQAVLESINEGVFTVDKNWKITYMNPAAREMTGFQMNESIGKFCQGLLHTNRCGENCPLLQTLQEDRALRDMPVTITRLDGHTLPVLVNTAVLKDSDGDTTGGVVVFRVAGGHYLNADEFSTEDQFEGIYGRDRSMVELYEMIQQVAPLSITVLITGESGTGKELVANAIVAQSEQRNGPFVKVNCSVLSESLLESELFGHAKGAFTGAIADHAGRFERAHGGTIFLDEIGEASLNVQLKLLRVIQEGEYERVGDTQTRKTDARVLAATNQDFKKLIKEGRFREDLYYRLSAVRLELPPLRNRGGDILLLTQLFIEKAKLKTGYSEASLSDDAYDRLINYSWPGNVRELENAIEYSLIRARGGLVTAGHLPREIQDSTLITKSSDVSNLSEESRLLKALQDANWNRSRASQLLGVSRTTLWRLMKKHQFKWT